MTGSRERLEAWAEALGQAHAVRCESCEAWTIRMGSANAVGARCSTCSDGPNRSPPPTRKSQKPPLETQPGPTPGMHQGAT